MDAVLDRDSVDNDKESAETRVADCVAGIVAEIEFPSNTMVGLVAVVARAGTPKLNKPPIVREIARATAVGLFLKVCVFMLTPRLCGITHESIERVGLNWVDHEAPWRIIQQFILITDAPRFAIACWLGFLSQFHKGHLESQELENHLQRQKLCR